MDVFILLKSLLKLSDDDVSKMRVLLAPAAIEGMAGQVFAAVQRMERIEAKLDRILSHMSPIGAANEQEYTRQIELFETKPGEFSND